MAGVTPERRQVREANEYDVESCSGRKNTEDHCEGREDGAG